MAELLDQKSAYLNNPLLKRANVAVEWTEENIAEYKKCMEDPLHFVQNYIKIVSLDEGLVPFKMFPFQKEILGTIHNNRFTIAKLPRQSGKCFHINTIVRVRNKESGEIKEITIGDLYEEIQKESGVDLS